MDPDFWHARWREGRIGFHRSDVNPHLQAHLAHLGQPRDDAAIFVPLCGKSVDVVFLAQRGYRVVGAEISELACRALLTEHALPYTERRESDATRFDAGAITLWCGDYFALTAAQLGPLCGAWDRAALFAMPAERRDAYMAQLARLLPSNSPLLLVTLEYPSAQMQGPPFSVPDAELRALCADRFEVESSESHEALSDNPRFRDAGLDMLHETVHRARRL